MVPNECISQLEHKQPTRSQANRQVLQLLDLIRKCLAGPRSQGWTDFGCRWTAQRNAAHVAEASF